MVAHPNGHWINLIRGIQTTCNFFPMAPTIIFSVIVLKEAIYWLWFYTFTSCCLIPVKYNIYYRKLKFNCVLETLLSSAMNSFYLINIHSTVSNFAHISNLSGDWRLHLSCRMSSWSEPAITFKGAHRHQRIQPNVDVCILEMNLHRHVFL